uniref:Putative reverse transcriptase domain-containing protein n=1 Tax=Tanacetum cinerariifolium TaxID=118510 RepID=A0A699H3D3_TANCI|nr:putative reverse transcriptase domain-containing protein [Tanacetum cinerariifolium]
MTPPSTHIDTILIPIVSSTIPSSPDYTPASPDYTPASPDYSPASDTESDLSEDLSSVHIPPLLATSPFISSIDDSSNIDISDTPPSPTHGTPFTETTLSTYRSPAASRDSSSSSSPETSSDPSSDDLSDSSSNHSLLAPSSGMKPSHHLCLLVPSIPSSSAAIFIRPSHDSSFASPFHKRSTSPAASVPLSSPILEAFSYARVDLLPLPKRIRSPESTTNLKGCSEDSFEPYVHREAGLGVDVEDESFEPSRYRGTDLKMDDDVMRSDGIDINREIQAKIDECIAYEDALKDRGIDARVVVEAIDQEEIKTGTRGPIKDRAVEVTYETLGDLVQRFHDHTVEILVHHVQAIESIQRDQGHMIVVTGQQSTDMLERIRELERVNMRLRDMMDVVSQRVTRCQCRELHVQREATVLRLFLEFPSVDQTMPNTRSRASRTHEGVNKQYDHRLAGALGARNAARNLESVIGNGGNGNEENGNRGIENGGNGNEENGNRGIENGGNGNGNGYTKRFQELVLLCTRMVPNEEEKVERFVGGQNVARAYTTENNKKKGYVGSLPYCNECKLHHAGPCTVRCGNCKRVSHMTRYCKVTVTLNTHSAPVGNHPGVDKSFVSSTFSALLDVAPSTLDTSYAIELAGGRISKTNVILRGCTLGLLGHSFDIDLMPIELGSFDVIIDMDSLAKYHVLIVCDEKVVRIPYGDEVLIIREFMRKTFQRQHLGLAMVTTSSRFEIVFIDNILIYSKSKKEYEGHLKLILRLLKKEDLYGKFSKCKFWPSKVHFLGHLIDSEGIHIDLAKIDSIKDWASPKTPTEIR